MHESWPCIPFQTRWSSSLNALLNHWRSPWLQRRQCRDASDYNFPLSLWWLDMRRPAPHFWPALLKSSGVWKWHVCYVQAIWPRDWNSACGFNSQLTHRLSMWLWESHDAFLFPISKTGIMLSVSFQSACQLWNQDFSVLPILILQHLFTFLFLFCSRYIFKLAISTDT